MSRMASRSGPAALRPLDRGQAHVWCVFPDEIIDAGLLAAYRRLMSPRECAREHRLRFAEQRHDFAIARALVRTVLSRYAAVDPRTWDFEANRYGRPHIASPGGVRLSFNLSHTDGLIACIVALDREVGIDVETTEMRGDAVKVADRYFAPDEVAALRALSDERRHIRSLEYWTLKESYIKARGMGLSLPLDRFSFHLDEGSPIRISFDPRLRDEPASWQFAQFRPSTRHLVGVSIRRGRDADLTVDLERTVPLVS